MPLLVIAAPGQNGALDPVFKPWLCSEELSNPPFWCVGESKALALGEGRSSHDLDEKVPEASVDVGIMPPGVN